MKSFFKDFERNEWFVFQTKVNFLFTITNLYYEYKLKFKTNK